ncbi:MAG TPA: tRNA (adenosine(37)-N6)-threonylcarbamoyltransferase complex transferase subunit TsaD, partial [Alphaproteobacteria bacterium]|nr:tRNA (adenosine(37)-N6)-threonylcarbamoyltransferase complex transferase subunit TsaD [Alphaproteobacteria bacterium]
GTTIDDAVGECFDKGAKLLGLGYPGGPLLEKAAQGGNDKGFNLPRPMLGREGCDFSFSGLKTALRQIVDQGLSANRISDAAASFQAAITDILYDRTRNAFAQLHDDNQHVTALVVAGGVAANQSIRTRLTALAAQNHVPFVAPPIELCTDNGVMVAWAGLEHLRLGHKDGLDTAARPRWPLDKTLAAAAGTR